jgi:hypothetical protein
MQITPVEGIDVKSLVAVRRLSGRMRYAIANILPESGHGSCVYLPVMAELGEIQ